MCFASLKGLADERSTTSDGRLQPIAGRDGNPRCCAVAAVSSERILAVGNSPLRPCVENRPGSDSFSDRVPHPTIASLNSLLGMSRTRRHPADRTPTPRCGRPILTALAPSAGLEDRCRGARRIDEHRNPPRHSLNDSGRASIVPRPLSVARRRYGWNDNPSRRSPRPGARPRRSRVL